MTHTIQAVAWTLIHFCWQAAAIAATYRVLSLALARRSSNARYLVALSALLLMCAASVATFSWELRSTQAARIAATADQSAGVAHVGYTFSPTTTPVADTLLPMQAGAPFTGVLSPALLLWIDALWIVGVVTLSLRSLGGWWLIQKLRVTATVEASAAAAASFRRIADALGLKKPVLLRVSSAIAGPVTVGALRALVLLPLSAATSLSPEELEVVLAHELAHVRRADFLWNLIQTLVETLFFFHPAVWWLGSRIRHERELCCDDLALTVCPDPIIYARALFRLEEQRGTQLQLAMALDGHQSRQTLRMRIARILGEPFTQTARRGPFSLAAAGALLVVLLLPVPQVLASLNPKPAVMAHSALSQVIARPEIAAARATVNVLHSTVTAVHAAMANLNPSAGYGEGGYGEGGFGGGSAAQGASVQSSTSDAKPSSQEASGHHGDYIDQMKAAGYDVDLDKMIAMKIQDVTPEYARSMSQIGFGKLTADQLISCKIQDVTADYIAQMKTAGYNADLDKYIAMKIQDVTPEYAQKMSQIGFGKLNTDELISAKIQDVTPAYIAEMKAAGYDGDMQKYISMKIQDVTPEYAQKMAQIGFGKLNGDELISAKIQDVTPEYIAQLKHDGLEVKTVQDAIQYRIFNVTPEFVTKMKAAGFGDLSHQQLMALRTQDVTPEYAQSIRQQYPGATVDDIVKTKIFNIDAGFIASAKRHGFNDLTLDKLVKLRISGILDDNESENK